MRRPLPSRICRRARALSDLHGVWCPATGLYPRRGREFLMCWFAVNCQRMKWHQWKPFQDIHLSCCHGLFFLCAWTAARSTTRSREAPRPFQGKGAPGLSARSGPTLFPPLPPPKGWGRIQKVYLDYEKRGVDPKWTLYKRNEVIREFGPWMDFWMLKCIRNIPVMGQICHWQGLAPCEEGHAWTRWVERLH